jgi:hypothetical protein
MVKRSFERNRERNITGILLCSPSPNGSRPHQFMQYIEGPIEPVISLYRSIETDPRHHNITTIRQGEVERIVQASPSKIDLIGGRVFPNWSFQVEAIDRVPDSIESFLDLLCRLTPYQFRRALDMAR